MILIVRSLHSIQSVLGIFGMNPSKTQDLNLQDSIQFILVTLFYNRCFQFFQLFITFFSKDPNLLVKDLRFLILLYWLHIQVVFQLIIRLFLKLQFLKRHFLTRLEFNVFIIFEFLIDSQDFYFKFQILTFVHQVFL